MSGRRILVLGATSAIAQAYMRRRAAERAVFMLVARNEARLGAIAADLRARGAESAEWLVGELGDADTIESTALALRQQFGAADEAVVAYGALGDQATSERDMAAARAILQTNFTSAALWILTLLRDRSAEKPFTLLVIGSVAGDRGRASNFIYGAAKGGLDRLLEGLAQKYAGTQTRIVQVKPGFVDTPMTAGIQKGGPLWATADQVAADMQRAVERGRRVVYTPWFWWPIMLIIRNLPWFIFKRLKI